MALGCYAAQLAIWQWLCTGDGQTDRKVLGRVVNVYASPIFRFPVRARKSTTTPIDGRIFGGCKKHLSMGVAAFSSRFTREAMPGRP